MKKFLLLICLFPSFIYSQSEYRAQFGIFAPIDIPLQSQMPRMSTNYGIGLQGSFSPVRNLPMHIEFKMSTGMYSYKNLKETYFFEDLSSMTTTVTYKSSMHRMQLGAKFYMNSYYSPVRAFATPQIGHTSMRSRIIIADPEDTDGCAPLESRIAHKSSGFTYGGEIGVDLDVKRIFTGNESRNQRMYLSISYLGSFKPMDYINIKHMTEHEHGMHAGHTMETEDGRDLITEFVNVTNGNIHKHKIAEVYTSKLNFITINVGYIWNF